MSAAVKLNRVPKTKTEVSDDILFGALFLLHHYFFRAFSVAVWLIEIKSEPSVVCFVVRSLCSGF